MERISLRGRPMRVLSTARGNTSTADYIAFHATERSHAIAIIDRERAITYAQLHQDLARFVRAVMELGLEPGRSIAIEWGDLYPHWLLLIACECLGLATASFHGGDRAANAPLLKSVDLVLSDVRPPDVPSERHHATTQDWLAGVLARAKTEMPTTPARLPDDPLRIVRTSGTTGEPKRLLLTRRMFEAIVERWAWSLGITRASRTLLNMPFVATGAYTLATTVIRAGGMMVHAGLEVGTADLLSDPEHGLTHLRITPLELKLVLDTLPPDFAKPASLVVCTVGAAVVAPLRDRTLARLASEVIIYYGCNEALFVAETRETTGEVASTIYPWVDVEIVDESDTPLPPGTIGKIRLRDEAMATGYLDDPDDTARKFRSGWFYPGDMGVLHGPRRLQIVGREDDILNIGGTKVAPSELEALVLRYATVGDIGVCTASNADGIGEICVAVVDPSLDDAKLLERITDAFRSLPLGRFHVVKIGCIPRNANGKIQRDVLKQVVVAAMARAVRRSM